MLCASAPDPYHLPEFANVSAPLGAYFGNSNTRGKARRPNGLVSGQTTKILITAGQSNICNNVNAVYSPANPAKIDNLNIYDGAIYAAADPLLGCMTGSMGNVMTQVADDLIANGWCDRIILVPTGIGATAVSDWSGSLFQRIVAARARCAALGLTPDGVCWHQGESDTLAGTTQANYLSRLNAVISEAWPSGKWLISLASWFNGSTSTAVRAAQASIVNGVNIFQGPDTDTIGSSGRWDNTHFNATGRALASPLWQAPIVAHF